MLLDLFVQHNAGTGVSVTSATIASDAPQATALRYVALMQREGLIERCSSKIDRRVCYLRLTQEGYRRIGTWLSSCAPRIA
jgi:DNA-binding IclR family transcriptional regulator